MSEYVTRRNTFIAEMVTESGVSAIEANQLLGDWEYEANRRGLDQRTSAFLVEGRAWIGGLVAARKSESG
jgi:hypothetical protein